MCPFRDQERDPSPARDQPSSSLCSDVLTALQLCGLREEMATHPRARHAEQILLVSHLSFLFFMRRFYYSPPPSQKIQEKKESFGGRGAGGWQKPLFVFCTTERTILMAQNEARLVMRLEFSTFPRRSDAVSQRLISAIAFWQTACQHSLAPQHLPIVCGNVK